MMYNLLPFLSGLIVKLNVQYNTILKKCCAGEVASQIAVRLVDAYE